MARYARFALFGAVALLLGACTAGREFPLPPSGSLVLGTTTPDQVVATLGKPLQRASSTTATENTDTTAPPNAIFVSAREGGRFERFTYAYLGRSSEVFNGGIRQVRVFVCTFWNGRLASYVGSSSFAADKTDFDDSKIASLVRDKTSGPEVLALFGKPSGGAVYPIISRPDGAALIYFYQEDDLSQKERRTKTLEIYLDQSGVVRDFRANSSSSPLPTAVAAPASVPIFIPSGKK